MINVYLQRLSGWLGAAAALALVSGAPDALAVGNPNFCLSGSTASNCLIQLDMINAPGSSFTYHNPGYITGSIQTTGNAHTLLITFDSSTFGGTTWNLGDLFLNVVDVAHVSVSGISFTDASPGDSKAPTFSVANTLSGGSYQADGWGNFNVELQDHNGTEYAASHLSFDVTWSDLTFSSLLTDAVLVLNGSGTGKGQADGGQSAAGHIYGVGQDGNTYYAAWPSCQDQNLTNCTTVTTVPEPATLALFATGLLGFGVAARRRRAVC